MKVPKYDPGRKGFYEIEIDDLAKEYESLNLTKKEIAPKIEEAQQNVANQIAQLLGVKEVIIKKTKTGKIKVEVKQ
jgi:hypothetical protein